MRVPFLVAFFLGDTKVLFFVKDPFRQIQIPDEAKGGRSINGFTEVGGGLHESSSCYAPFFKTKEPI